MEGGNYCYDISVRGLISLSVWLRIMKGGMEGFLSCTITGYEI